MATKTPVVRGAPPNSHLGRRQPHPRQQQGRPAGRQAPRLPRHRFDALTPQRRCARQPWLSDRDDAHGHRLDRHLNHAPGSHDQVTSLTAHASSDDHPRGQSYPGRGALTRARPVAGGSSSFSAGRRRVNPLELRRFPDTSTGFRVLRSRFFGDGRVVRWLGGVCASGTTSELECGDCAWPGERVRQESADLRHGEASSAQSGPEASRLNPSPTSDRM